MGAINPTFGPSLPQNPFFRNAASHWPNVISIPSDQPKRKPSNAATRPDVPSGFISRRHRSVSKDRVLLRRLESLVAEEKLDNVAGDDALRAHFRQLTEKMLVPLNRYFQTLVPAPSASSTASLSGLKPFSIPDFLKHLKTRGPNPLSFKARGLTTKARVEADFYASFCMSPTFAGWLSSRVESLGIAVAAAEVSGGVGGSGTVRGRGGFASNGDLQGSNGDGESTMTKTMGDMALSDGTGSTTPSSRASTDRGAINPC